MTLQSVTTAAKRAAQQCKVTQHAIAKRGMFALVERRVRASWLLGAYAIHVTYTPAIVTSVTRDGIVKAVKLVGQDWPLKRSDWHEITVDNGSKISDPEAVAAKLVDGDGRATRYESLADAITAIKAAAGLLS